MGRKANEVKAKERFFRILLSAGFTDITKNFYKEKGYSEEVLANYSELIKRAFQKGKYIINCDYGVARILFDCSSEPIGFERISDKLIALTIYLSTLKSKSSRTKFGSSGIWRDEYFLFRQNDIMTIFYVRIRIISEYHMIKVK